VQQLGGLRSFVRRPVGRALLLAFAILVTFATYVYVSTLLAIPVLLLVGLAVPIWLGVKRLRTLALFGLVVLLVVAPLATLVITQDIRIPIGAASSPVAPGTNGSLMQNAHVTPYTGSTSTNFTWNVTVYPQFIPAHNSSPLWLNLFISTCPGATSNSDFNCASGYPFYLLNFTFPAGNLTTATTVTFHFQFSTDGIWEWQMGLYLRNTSVPVSRNNSSALVHPYTFILLTGDPVYNALEGPVVGDFAATYEELVLTVYLNDFVYLGIPYFVVLLIYTYITRRKVQRAEMLSRAAGPTPADSDDAPSRPSRPTDAPSSAKRPAPAPRRPELDCPNCGAVVYANETTCWKCGTAIPAGTSSTPLPSDPSKK
jgi:hypothetical protein